MLKLYYDHYDHPAGDLCIQRVVQALAGCVRAEVDLLARYGGEEFALVLPGAGSDGGAVAAQCGRGAVPGQARGGAIGWRGEAAGFVRKARAECWRGAPAIAGRPFNRPQRSA